MKKGENTQMSVDFLLCCAWEVSVTQQHSRKRKPTYNTLPPPAQPTLLPPEGKNAEEIPVDIA